MFFAQHHGGAGEQAVVQKQIGVNLVRKHIPSISLSGFACLIICLITYSLVGASAEESQGLEKYIAQAIVEEIQNDQSFENISLQGVIVSYVSTTKTNSESFYPKQIWRYNGSELKIESSNALIGALSDNRSEWPLFTFIFTYESKKSNKVVIDLHTYYSRGLWEDSRGGNAQKWTLVKKSEKWVVSEKKQYLNWD